MEYNFLQLYYALHSKVLISEAGTLWADLVLGLRRESRDDVPRPSATMRAFGGDLDVVLEEERCVRHRGVCADEQRPPYGSLSKRTRVPSRAGTSEPPLTLLS